MQTGILFHAKIKYFREYSKNLITDQGHRISSCIKLIIAIEIKGNDKMVFKIGDIQRLSKIHRDYFGPGQARARSFPSYSQPVFPSKNSSL